MIGELRDTESLQVAHQLALTGHLTLGGMHVNDAPGVLVRMREMGSPPVLINGSVRLIIAQRLIRNLCECSVKDSPPDHLIHYAEAAIRAGGLDWDSLPKTFRKPKGCARCAQTGYRGRDAVAETLELTSDLMQAVERNAPVEELRERAVAGGMRTMVADAIRRAAEGKTTLAEVMRVFGLG
jgi:type II secretory ATPase GspE/PulE/Tfp pilus assembly ATPase PilB-like protein